MTADAFAGLLQARCVGRDRWQALDDSRQRRKRIAVVRGYRACTRRIDETADVLFNGTPKNTDELGREFHESLDFQRAVEMEAFI